MKTDRDTFSFLQFLFILQTFITHTHFCCFTVVGFWLCSPAVKRFLCVFIKVFSVRCVKWILLQDNKRVFGRSIFIMETWRTFFRVTLFHHASKKHISVSCDRCFFISLHPSTWLKIWQTRNFIQTNSTCFNLFSEIKGEILTATGDCCHRYK